jgi:hypothetical protein
VGLEYSCKVEAFQDLATSGMASEDLEISRKKLTINPISSSSPAPKTNAKSKD